MPQISVIIAIALLLSSPMAIDAVAGNAIDPDNPLYPIEKFGETQIDIILRVNPPSRVMFKLKCGDERLIELNRTAKKLPPDRVEFLLHEYNACIAESLNESAKMDREDLIAMVKERLAYHRSVLEQCLERVPEEAKPAIEKAIQESSRCEEIVEKALRREIPIRELPKHIRKRRK